MPFRRARATFGRVPCPFRGDMRSEDEPTVRFVRTKNRNRTVRIAGNRIGD